MGLQSDSSWLPGMVQDALSRIGVLLHTLFEAAGDAIFVMEGMVFRDCNPATLRMFGCRAKDEILGHTVLEFSPAQQADGASSAERATQLVVAALAGVSQHFEWRHRRMDGTEFEVEVRLNLFMAAGVRFLVAVVRDVSARKQAEAMLRRQLAASSLMHGILTRGARCPPGEIDSQTLDALRELAEFMGADHAYLFVSAPDRASYDCTHEWCAPGVLPLREAYQKVPAGTAPWIEGTLLGRKVVSMERVAARAATPAVQPDVRDDAGCRSRLIVPTSGAADAATGEGVAAIGVDSHAREVAWSESDRTLCDLVGDGLTGMMERKSAAEKLLREKHFSERLIDSLPGIFYVYDADLRLRRWNKNHEAPLGYTADELLGRHVLEFLATEESRRRALEVAQALIEKGGPTDFSEVSVLRKDGSVRPFAVSAARVDSAEGPMFVGVGFDISLRKEAERALAASERKYHELMVEAQAANAAKDEFLAVLSHELRNPLAAIQASIGVLRQLANGDEPRTSRAVDVIERNVRLQARLVSDLLDLSHLVRGKLQIQRAPLQLEEVVLSAVQACRADAARADVSLETQVAAGVWVNADADRIQQVIINLVDNGIKFTPRGGKVSISVLAGGGRGHVVVEDTGLGIARERLPEIFEMFRQGEIAARRAPGLGIGLALVRSITDLHGGSVRAESEGPGRGSRFIVELPATDAPVRLDACKAAERERASYKMLLLEDNEDTRAMLMETFMAMGYQVSAAESAEAALDLLARESPDVILADVGLPGMDGYEFLRHARHLPGAAHSLALVLTGYGQPRDVQRAREAGYDDHFVKPADIALIHQRIRSGLLAADAGGGPTHSNRGARAP